MGLPFMPVRGIVGTDYTLARPDLKVIQNPYGEDQVALVPPIRPDVSIMHSFAADPEGNVLVDSFENDPLLARASRRVYASTESILPWKTLKAMEGIIIPSTYIHGVIPVAGGASPTRCRGFYPYKDQDILAYLHAARGKEPFGKYAADYLTKGGLQP